MLSEDRAWWNIWLDGVVLKRQELVEVGIGNWWWSHWDPGGQCIVWGCRPSLRRRSRPRQVRWMVEWSPSPAPPQYTSSWLQPLVVTKEIFCPWEVYYREWVQWNNRSNWCRGSSVAFTLLNASRRSAYWEGRWTTSEFPWVRVMVLTVTGMLWLIHC